MSFIANVLSYFYDLWPSYAGAIALLTVTVMVVLLPLTIKGTRSMLAMQKLSPEIKKLQDRHKNDRQKLNEEVMALYKDNKINPLGGCLPLLLQIPVFIILYRVISGVTHHNKAGNPDPKYIKHSSQLYHDIVAAGGKLESFGIDLAQSASSAAHKFSFVDALPYWIMIVVMVGVQYWQQWQVTSRQPAADTPQAQQMRTVQKIFPLMFAVISFGIPAGVVLYWIISTLFRVAQQSAMYRFDPLLKTTVASATKEAEEFLEKDKPNPRAQKSPGRSNNNNNKKKKRKGR